MEGILEIKGILNKLSYREKKAAKKYFALHYKNTKELQLFNLIDQSNSKNRMNLENRICNLGYESSSCKSFQKLRSRFKQKLFDHLSSSMSINEMRRIDSNSFLRHRLKKMLFQSDVLIEKGLFFQANDLLRSSLRISQEYEQIPEIIESLEKLKSISRHEGNFSHHSKLDIKIMHFKKMLKVITSIESEFAKLHYLNEVEGMNHISDKLSELSDIIDTSTVSSNHSTITLFRDLIQIFKLQEKEEFHNAIGISIRWLKEFRIQSAKYDVNYKMMVYNSFVELLFLTGHNKQAINFILHPKIKEKPTHCLQQLTSIGNHFALLKNKIFDFHPNFDTLGLTGKDRLIRIYQKAHFYFSKMNYHKTLDIINQNIRSYAISSVQQLDLMVLELMCNYELKRFDLLEYRIQSFLKNLAYRSHYNLPLYYHLVYKILNVRLRSMDKEDNALINKLVIELKASKSNGLYRYKSFQPLLFTHWIEEILGTTEESKEEITTITEGIYSFNQVA